LARAEKVKLLFADELSPDEMEVNARLAGDCESTKTNLLHGAIFKWVTRNDDIIEELDKTLVFYKYGTTEEVYSQNLKSYFSQLAEVLKSTNDRILITGHTDATSSAEFNLALGLRRANEFKSHLIGLGVDESRITVESKGETMPRATNDTPEGQQQNRRVEIQILETN
jgi:outer membrane protein OmpA-like peptidoglycan-associated protein